MKTIIRVGTFETNSSSSHSLGIVSEKDYYKWVEGKLLYNENSGNFVPIEEGKNLVTKGIAKRKEISLGSSDKITKNLLEDEISERLLHKIESDVYGDLKEIDKLLKKRKEITEEIYEEYGFFTYERYFDDCDHCFEEPYTPKSTEKIIIFGTFNAG